MYRISKQDKQRIRANVLILVSLIASLAILSFFNVPASRPGFVSSEVKFTDSSPGGLQIVPASCASGIYHTALPPNPDGLSYVTRSPEVEYGADKFLTSVCVTNNTGVTYFVPANTAAEFQSFKAVGTRIPGLTVN